MKCSSLLTVDKICVLTKRGGKYCGYYLHIVHDRIGLLRQASPPASPAQQRGKQRGELDRQVLTCDNEAEDFI
jgi:hypothetical protein